MFSMNPMRPSVPFTNGRFRAGADVPTINELWPLYWLKNWSEMIAEAQMKLEIEIYYSLRQQNNGLNTVKQVINMI